MATRQFVNLNPYEAAQLNRRANAVSPIDAALQSLQQGMQLQQLPQTLQDQALQRQLNNALLSQKLSDLQNPNAALARKLTEELTLKGALNPNLGIAPAPAGTLGQTIANPGAITPEQQASLLTQDPIDFVQPTAPMGLPETPIAPFGIQTGLNINPNVPLQTEARALHGKIDLINARPANAILTKDGYIFDPRARTVSDAPINGSNLADQRRDDVASQDQAKMDRLNAQIASQERILGRKLTAQELEAEKDRLLKSSEGEKDRESRETIANKRAKLAAAADAPKYQAERQKRVLDSVADLKKDVGYDTVGFADWFKAIPTTASRNFAGRLKTLKGAIAFGELAAMREASKTGGALGAVSNMEIGLLESALGNLDQAQSPSEFIEELEKISSSIERWQTEASKAGATTQPSPTVNSNLPKVIKITPRAK